MLDAITWDQIADAVRGELAAALECGPGEVDLAERVTELPGIDSSKLVEVVVACERRWDIALDEEALFDVLSAADLCDLIQQTVNERRAT